MRADDLRLFAVRIHCVDYLSWNHGPRRGQKEERRRKGPWFLLLSLIQHPHFLPVRGLNLELQVAGIDQVAINDVVSESEQSKMRNSLLVCSALSFSQFLIGIIIFLGKWSSVVKSNSSAQSSHWLALKNYPSTMLESTSIHIMLSSFVGRHAANFGLGC